MADENKKDEARFGSVGADAKLTIGTYVTLIAGFLILSGLLTSLSAWPGLAWVKAFDFNSLAGKYGMIEGAKGSFLGEGGTGAKYGFLFALSLVPGVMLSLGILNIIEKTGGLEACRRWLTPIMRPIFGLPGCASLSMIASMQSTDAGAVLTRHFYDTGEMSDRERIIFTQYELSGSAAISNYITIGAAAFSVIVVPSIMPLFLILLMKCVGTNVTRFALKRLYKPEPAAANAAPQKA